jgi:hypothetical protein
VAETWRRCGSCRKVRPIEDFTTEESPCQACRSGTAARATRSRGRGAASEPAPAVVGRAAAGVGGQVSTATTTPVRDLTGRGDPEVRARRARLRALDRLIEWHPDDFAVLLAEERAAERL